MSKPTLPQLPAELLVPIYEQLRRQDISRLSRTCKRLRQGTLSLVYRHIEWDWYSSTRLSLQKCMPPLHLLARSLVSVCLLPVSHILYLLYIVFNRYRLRYRRSIIYSGLHPAFLLVSDVLSHLGNCIII